MEGVKKTSLRVWRKSARNLSRAHRYRYGSRTRSGWPEEQTHLSLGQKGVTSARQPRSTHPIDPSVRRGMPAKRGAGVALLAPPAASSRPDRRQGHPPAATRFSPRSRLLTGRKKTCASQAASRSHRCRRVTPRAQQPGKHRQFMR